jgi:prepilin-type processing-associated H-X9-DG protein
VQPFTGQQNFWGTNFGAGRNAPLGFMDPNAVQNWGRETFPYVKSMDMYVSTVAGNDVRAGYGPVPNNGAAGRTSYVMNGCVSRTSQTAASKPAELIVISNRATTVREAVVSPRRNYFTDGARHANDADLNWTGFNFSGGGNYAFADGHAKFRMRKQVKFKDLGYWEWVNIFGKGWTDPNTNPTMLADPKNAGDENWKTWGACDPAQVP